jgi:guanylate kinase
MSYNLSHFADARNFSVVRGVVRFRCPGNSYLEKLKNGLSLDSVIRSQLICELSKNLLKDIANKQNELSIRKDFSLIDEHFFDISPPKLRKLRNKKKSNQKKKRNSISKKLIRAIGYTYKQWEYDQKIVTDQTCDNDELCNACLGKCDDYF